MKNFPSVTVFLDNRRAKLGKDVYPIKLKITFKRERKYYNTGINSTKTDYESILNTTKRVKDSLLVAKEKIFQMKAKADQVISKMEIFNFHDFELIFLGETYITNNDIFSCYEALMKRPEISLGTIETYKNSSSSFKKYIKKEKTKYSEFLPFNMVTSELINSWVVTMREEGKSNATIGIYTRCLRSVFNYAIEKEFTKPTNYPFGKKKFSPPTKNNVKKVPTKETLGKILSAELDILSPQKKARDFFILSYLWNGMNIGDMLNLKNKDFTETGIVYYRIKTAHTGGDNQPIQIRFGESWREKVFELVNTHRNSNNAKDCYLFDIYKKEMGKEEKRRIKKNFIRYINQHLKKLCHSLEIEEDITTYHARHSFATQMMIANAPINDIKELLGHSNIRTTQNYLHSLENINTRTAINSLL